MGSKCVNSWLVMKVGLFVGTEKNLSLNKVPTLKMAVGFILLSLSREPADSLEEIFAQKWRGGWAGKEAGVGALAVVHRGCRSVAALGLILDLTVCFLPRILVP